MLMELLAMNGYGQFVWPAFIFTLASCLCLYLKTRIEFKKLEKVYSLEYKETQVIKVQFDKGKKSKKEALLIN